MPTNSAAAPARPRKGLILRISAAALVLVAAVIVALPLAAMTTADTNVAAADASVRKAEEAAGLLDAAEVKAAAEIMVAAQERKTAESTAVLAKSMRSFMIGTIATREGLNRDYESAMDEAAAAYDKVVDAHDAIVVKSDDAARELTVEKSAQADAAAARDAASGAVDTSMIAGGILTVIALALIAFSFFVQRKSGAGVPETAVEK